MHSKKILDMAYELIDHHGDQAVQIARERIISLSKSPDIKSLDEAFEVLTAIGMLLEEAELSEKQSQKH